MPRRIPICCGKNIETETCNAAPGLTCKPCEIHAVGRLFHVVITQVFLTIILCIMADAPSQQCVMVRHSAKCAQLRLPKRGSGTSSWLCTCGCSKRMLSTAFYGGRAGSAMHCWLVILRYFVENSLHKDILLDRINCLATHQLMLASDAALSTYYMLGAHACTNCVRFDTCQLHATQIISSPLHCLNCGTINNGMVCMYHTGLYGS